MDNTSNSIIYIITVSMTTRTDNSTTNEVTWTNSTENFSNINILLDVNWDNIFDVNNEQIYVIWWLVPIETPRTDTFTPGNTVRS